MLKRLIFWLILLALLIPWPLALIKSPSKVVTGFIWQLADAQEEKKILIQKLGLDASPVKKIFYNTKTTILFDRYTSNILTLLDFPKYFFSATKFTYPAIVAFMIGVYISIKNKKRLKLWLTAGMLVLLISFFKKVDGWDFGLYPVLAVIIFDGLRKIWRLWR